MHLAAKLAACALVPAALFAGKVWLGPGCCPGGGAEPDGAVTGHVTGHYVEARTASVFAGACHYNGEYTTDGREQLLAWQLTGGAEAGVSLAGVELVAVVSADRNLAEPGARRRSVVYLDEQLAPAVREAALAWLEREHGAVLGEVRKVKTGAVSVDCDGERYAVDALGLVRLEGEAMHDRACCSMPSNVWYGPEVALSERLVGHTEVFSVADPDVGPAFERRGENDAFLGSLARPAQALCPSLERSSCCPKEASQNVAP